MKYDYYIVDKLGYYYAGHKNGFADYTKDFSKAKKFWSYDAAKMNCKSLGISYKVVGVERN